MEIAWAGLTRLVGSNPTLSVPGLRGRLAASSVVRLGSRTQQCAPLASLPCVLARLARTPGDGGSAQRRAAKKLRSRVAESAPRTPPITRGRWFRAGSARTSRTLPAAPAFGSGAAKTTRRDAGEDDRAGAHRAGLEGHVEGRVGEAPAAELLGRGADRQHLGVGGRVAAQLALVARRGEQLAVAQQGGADRHVAVLLRPAGLGERDLHAALVRLRLFLKVFMSSGLHRCWSIPAGTSARSPCSN